MDPKGQVALVTGGASGLGAATAEVLAAAGAKVALLDVNEKAASENAAKLGGIGVACDVIDEQSATNAIAKVREKFGVARILVNCAGVGPAKRILGRDGPMPLADYRKVIEINLVGTFNMLRLAAADMSKADPLPDGERGVIVSTASVAAFEGQVGQAAYASSKGGVAALTLPAARELSQFAIRVAAIAPGIFGTPMLMALPQETQDSLGASVPFPKRLGAPREFGELVLAIVRNGYINGEVIRIDGALRMAPRCMRRKCEAVFGTHAQKMLKNSRALRIEWGDCDPAGIVFYPRFFAMFDHSTTTLITAATGLNKYELFQTYDFAGYPMVDTRARFMIPCRFGDDVTIEFRVCENRPLKL